MTARRRMPVGIVEFQLAMLEDPTLLEPVMERIATGGRQPMPGRAFWPCRLPITKRPMTIISGPGRAILPISRIACCVFLPARRMPRCRPARS